MRATLLGFVLLAQAAAALPAAAGDFVPRCAVAMQAALPKAGAAGLEAFCQCTEGRARTNGASQTELMGYVTALEQDPKAKAPPKIQGAAVACFQQEIQKVNRQADEAFRRTAERRNQGDAQLAYRWTAWRRTSDGLEELEAPSGAWPVEIGGVACELGAARTREHLDGRTWMRDVVRTLTCPGAEVKVTGTQILPSYVGCSHSRDGAIGIEGRGMFEVRPRGGGQALGSLMLACDRSDG
jgi:hypothetical protein